MREKHYIRYMDDFVILHHDKQHLHKLRAKIEEWLWLNLQLKPTVKRKCSQCQHQAAEHWTFLVIEFMQRTSC
ncbi:hypothetical protein ACT691_06835 [Vibrio metschnikovii]